MLLAEHRPAPSCLPIWTVPDLDAAVGRLGQSGFETHGETAGTPDGPVHVLRDPSGNEIGLLQQDRPDALVRRYADPDHENAVRDDAGLAHAAVCVPDVEAATRWYEPTLGFTVQSPPYLMEGEAIGGTWASSSRARGSRPRSSGFPVTAIG